MTTTSPPTQASALPSFVEAPKKRKSHTQDGGYDISYPSDPARVAFTFNGASFPSCGSTHSHINPTHLLFRHSSGSIRFYSFQRCALAGINNGKIWNIS